MRQAQESAIIRLSMHVREGKDFRTFPSVSGEVLIVPHRYQFISEDQALLQASQVICGTNNDRNRFNKRIRNLLGKGELPEVGDKIIGLDNHWDDISQEGNALTNGAIGIIKEYKVKEQIYPTTNARWNGFPAESKIMWTDFETDDGDYFRQLPIDYDCIVTGNPLLTGKQEAIIANYNKGLDAKARRDPWYDASRYYKEIPYHFNYGYSITCWKSQGSQYENVLGYEAGWLKSKNPEEYSKYIYTLITRAEKKLILVGD